MSLKTERELCRSKCQSVWVDDSAAAAAVVVVVCCQCKCKCVSL